MAICDKTTTNKWTYERSHKSLNSYSLVEHNKIYPNINPWKNLQEESLWKVDFDNLYLWNTLNKTHQGTFVYPNINPWKTLQEESLWQVDFDNLYFWNTLNKTHHGTFVWNINNRLHTSIRNMCIKKEKKQHMER